MSTSNVTANQPYTKPQPVLIAGTVITFCAIVFGGLGLVAGLNDNGTVGIIAGIGALVTGAANQALAYYVKGQVVPVSDVAEYRDSSGDIVAGPLSPVPNGTVVDTMEELQESVTTTTTTAVPFDGLPTSGTYAGDSKSDAAWHPPSH